MFRKLMLLIGIFGVLVVWVSGTRSEESTEKKIESFQQKFEDILAGKGEGGAYVGVKPCVGCHTTEKSGAQVKVWKAAAHSKAYESLLSEDGKKRAAAKGIQKPEEDTNCLQCHAPIVTLPKELVGPKYLADEGVGCETCHGPLEKHVLMEKQALKEKREIPEAVSMIIRANDMDLKKVLCARCHREHEWHESVAFDLDASWKKIAHMRPKETTP